MSIESAALRLTEVACDIEELRSAVEDLKRIRSELSVDYMRYTKAELTGLIDGIYDIIDNGIGPGDSETDAG